MTQHWCQWVAWHEYAEQQTVIMNCTEPNSWQKIWKNLNVSFCINNQVAELICHTPKHLVLLKFDFVDSFLDSLLRNSCHYFKWFWRISWFKWCRDKYMQIEQNLLVTSCHICITCRMTSVSVFVTLIQTHEIIRLTLTLYFMLLPRGTMVK